MLPPFGLSPWAKLRVGQPVETNVEDLLIRVLARHRLGHVVIQMSPDHAPPVNASPADFCDQSTHTAAHFIASESKKLLCHCRIAPFGVVPN
ncbi:hypothetical protein [Mesorhizobium sp. M0590]|uniref:hypothetical protein n=1 Tax=Mesorhizobium sp. M0590 TaxID=2956966 RepID=UPI003339EEAB